MRAYFLRPTKASPMVSSDGQAPASPMFGNHGFVRNKMWVIEDNPPSLHNVDSNVGGAEAFSERLKKELQPLEATNVHAILESEPMIDEAQSFNLPTVSFLHQALIPRRAGSRAAKFLAFPGE
ncbi:Exocyst complex component SEC3A [Senna tora]|uniref:Exocyst complex component SEC3A n=1 Tax=Senna tora TaxID=362788 RepID=A0A834WHC7_9FABA|nr:Exocyst complex component SEC3A [Senna tora]